LTLNLPQSRVCGKFEVEVADPVSVELLIEVTRCRLPCLEFSLEYRELLHAA
jgi:hypothetical protein